MKAMILAAGRGKRMGALTADTPKPLLKVRGMPLLENKIIALKQAGIVDIVINVAYLAEKIQEFAGDGRTWEVNIQYSEETEALETAGGIARALPLLGGEPFLVINADVWTDYPLRQLCSRTLADNVLGHLVMVKNPAQHAAGDFALDNDGFLFEGGCEDETFTFSGIAIYHPNFIKDYPNKRERFPLMEVFQYTIAKKQLSGECYRGCWDDIGTPDRLQFINQS